MKKQTILTFLTVILMGFIVIYTGCKKDDDDDDVAGTSTTDLLAKQVTAAPAIDGVLDGGWSASQMLVTTVTVPDPGQNVFQGYVGNSYEVNMRAMYDANNLYILAEWVDDREDRNRQTWYFDPADSKWHQEDRNPTFVGGTQTRQPFYEDKFALLFNVNNSVPNWNTQSCYATCHVGLSEADGFARHYTGGTNEFIDMWHWKYVRSNINNQADDQYQNDDKPNGRHGDTKASGGYSNNIQTLNNGVEEVSVPKYFIPNRTDYSWITVSEINSGIAMEITGVDATGILTYSGGTINPNTDTDYQRDGESTGPKCIPSIYTEAFVGNRGNIEAKGVYTGNGWILEMKRALKTGDTENQDVDFSSLDDFGFGIGVFDNAGIAHAIKANLTLKFEK